MKRFLLLLSVCAAGILPGAAEEDRKDGVSASGKIGWHVVKADDGVNVFLSEADQGESAAQKLCEVPSLAHTEVSVSPDDSCIIVRSGGASLGTSLTLYRRENGMIYNEVPEADIAAVVLAAACGGDKAKAETMDRVHAEVAGWAADSKSVLVRVDAKGGGKTVAGHLAIYDLAAGTAGYDLVKFNAASAAKE